MTLAAGAGNYAGPLGLLVVLLMGVATVLLIKNMSTRIKRLPPSFEPTSKGEKDKTDEIDPDDLAG